MPGLLLFNYCLQVHIADHQVEDQSKFGWTLPRESCQAVSIYWPNEESSFFICLAV